MVDFVVQSSVTALPEKNILRSSDSRQAVTSFDTQDSGHLATGIFVRFLRVRIESLAGIGLPIAEVSQRLGIGAATVNHEILRK